MTVGVFLGEDEMGRLTIIKSYVIEGQDINYPEIRKRVPKLISDVTLKRRLSRGVSTWNGLSVDPAFSMMQNGKRNGSKFNATWRAQKQSSIESQARKKKLKENHGW